VQSKLPYRKKTDFQVGTVVDHEHDVATRRPRLQALPVMTFQTCMCISVHETLTRCRPVQPHGDLKERCRWRRSVVWTEALIFAILRHSTEPARVADKNKVAGYGAAKSDTCLIWKCICVASCW